MKKRVMLGIFGSIVGMGLFHNSVFAGCMEDCQNYEGDKYESCVKSCCEGGIKLNTDVPFIGNCIEFGTGEGELNQVNAFPKLMGSLMNIVSTAMLIIGFLMIVIGGVMMAMGGISEKNFSQGKGMIIKVGTVLALLGLSGVILKLINPTFFT